MAFCRGCWALLRLSPGRGAVGPTSSGDRAASCPCRAGGPEPRFPHPGHVLGSPVSLCPSRLLRLLVGEQETSVEDAGLPVDGIKDQTKGLE